MSGKAAHVGLGGGALGGVLKTSKPLNATRGAVEVDAVDAHAVGAGEVVQLLLHVRVEVDRHVAGLRQSKCMIRCRGTGTMPVSTSVPVPHAVTPRAECYIHQLLSKGGSKSVSGALLGQ